MEGAKRDGEVGVRKRQSIFFESVMLGMKELRREKREENNETEKKD